MAKNIFQPIEVLDLKDVQILDPPVFGPINTEQGVSEKFTDTGSVRAEVSLGPTVEQLRREADEFRKSLEEERKQVLSKANDDASLILKEAQRRSEEVVNTAHQEAESIKNEIEKHKTDFDEDLKKLKDEALIVAHEESEKMLNQSRALGLKEGKEVGYDDGSKEVGRLVQRLHVIIDRVLDKRKDILISLEGQVIELAILIVRRVVKVLSENQKNVVINNIVQALDHLKSRGDIVIRVNLADLECVTEHKDIFVRQIEGDGKLTLAEDSSVGPGGCIIETDFGEIDARISSQLSEIESRIRDLVPITLRPGALGNGVKL